MAQRPLPVCSVAGKRLEFRSELLGGREGESRGEVPRGGWRSCRNSLAKWEPSEVRAQDWLAASSSWVATSACGKHLAEQGVAEVNAFVSRLMGEVAARSNDVRVAQAVPLTGSPDKGAQRCAEVVAARGRRR